MAIEIPNIVQLIIELSVAFLILIVDQRSRRRESAALIREQEIDRKHWEAQQIQMERFSGWIQEDSKRQLMMLESIVASLDEEKAKVFRSEVGQRYTDEISRDLEDLEDLLEKREGMGSENDPALESSINQKFDELSSAQEIAGSFLPKNFEDSIRSISQTAREAFQHMSNLSDMENIEIQNSDEVDDIKVSLSEAKIQQFKEDRAKLETEIEALKFEIGKTIAESTTQVTDKLSGMFDSSKIEKGIKDFVSKIASKKEQDPSQEYED